MDKILDLYVRIPKSSCKEGCAECCYDMIQVSPEESERMGGYEWKGKCIFLQDNKCTIYERRAFICHLFGTSDTLCCQGCVPERYLSESETKELVKEYVSLGFQVK